MDRGEQVVVGVNRFALEEELRTDLLRVSEDVRAEQIARTQQVIATRDGEEVSRRLAAVAAAAASDDNLLPPMREALRARATLQEVCDVLREAFGTYVPVENL